MRPPARDAAGAPNAPPGPAWTIESDVTTLYGKRRVRVRLAGGRRFTIVTGRNGITDDGLRVILDDIASTRPAYPMTTIEGD